MIVLKKVLVLVLSVLLICSALPVTVFAESEEKCGDNLVWSIDSETETLTISGSGDMYDYGSRNEPRRAPWISYDGDIKHIVISEGVTSVGNDSFFTLYPETVSLPGTLVRIGEYSFACSGLIKLKIPASVEVIEEGAFDSSDSLTEVCFETGRLKSIGKYAFGHCLKLETIILPQSDVEIGYGAFYKTAVKTLDIPKGITAIGKSAFKSCEALTRVTLPEGLTEIEDGAFSFCSSLASIEFPDTLSVIGDQAFACCSLLTTVKFPDSIISIGEEAFTLTSLIEAVFGKNIKKIGANAFYGTNLSAVFLPPSAEQTYGAFANSAGRVITVYGVPGSMAEYTGRDNFISLNLPAAERIGITEITLVSYDGLEYSTDGQSWQSSPVFLGLNSDTEYTFYQRYAATETAAASPSTTPTVIKTNAGEFAGENYWEYDSVTETLTVCGNTFLSDYTSDYYAQGWSDFKTQIKRLKIINADGKIGSYAFSKLTSLKEVTICEGITAIGDSAFRNSVNLENITFPRSVKEIGDCSFLNSGFSGAVDLSGVSAIGDKAFMNTSLTEARFSKNTVYLGFDAFAGTKLQKAAFAGDAEFIAKTAFGDNAETVIYCNKGAGAESYAAENGMSYRYFGDLDSDGYFTATDLSLLKRYLLNSDSAFDPTASDVNADSRVDILDLVRLKKLAAKA